MYSTLPVAVAAWRLLELMVVNWNVGSHTHVTLCWSFFDLTSPSDTPCPGHSAGQIYAEVPSYWAASLRTNTLQIQIHSVTYPEISCHSMLLPQIQMHFKYTYTIKFTKYTQLSTPKFRDILVLLEHLNTTLIATRSAFCFCCCYLSFSSLLYWTSPDVRLLSSTSIFCWHMWGTTICVDTCEACRQTQVLLLWCFTEVDMGTPATAPTTGNVRNSLLEKCTQDHKIIRSQDHKITRSQDNLQLFVICIWVFTPVVNNDKIFDHTTWKRGMQYFLNSWPVL